MHIKQSYLINILMLPPGIISVIPNVRGDPLPHVLIFPCLMWSHESCLELLRKFPFKSSGFLPFCFASASVTDCSSLLTQQFVVSWSYCYNYT